MDGIWTVRMAAEAMGDKETVTAAHTACAVLCLKAKCFQHCEDLFSKSITNCNKHMKPIDVANYNMYRGLIFNALHKFEKAFDCFRAILQQPTKCVHQVHIDAYKKLSLLSMINTGKEFELPEDTADTVSNCVSEMNQMSSMLMSEGLQGGNLMDEMKIAQEEGQHSLRIYNQIG